MISIDTKNPIMVTGASGYVAGWVVKYLLEAGATVHATVRDPDDMEKVGHLLQMAENAPGKIHLFKADLLRSGSFAEAMKGCSVVFHTASPFTLNVADPKKDLVDPALKGTRNVLEQVNATESVARVVLTSSCAAIYDGNVDCAHGPGGRIDESMWNTTSTLETNAYSYSKTLAEKAAWEIAEKQNRWKLVVINPCLVIGPATHKYPTSESFNIIKQMGSGRYKAGAPRWGVGVVDVRDVAQAHIAAAFLPEAHGRNITAAHETDMYELAQSLRAKYGKDYPLPSRVVPKWLVWLVGPIASGLSRRAISRNVDVAFKADNSKAIRELGVTYRPLQDSMEEMFQQMIDAGQFKK